MFTREPTDLREAYGAALLELGHQNPAVVAVDADVSNSTKSIYFGKAFPQRFFNVGIAELHMVAMSGGLAASGLIPFCHSFATFLVLRGGDAIQTPIAQDKLNVKLVGAYSGLSATFEGASHHTLNDIALLRALPNMTILTACDGPSTRSAVFAAAKQDGPVYLRLFRGAVKPIYTKKTLDYRVGGSSVLRKGSDVTLLATGLLVAQALLAAEQLEAQGVSARVIDCYSIKPLDTKTILQAAAETGAVVTIEEHNIYGGFGSAVCELLATTNPTPVALVGIPDVFAESGEYDALLEKYQLNASAIVEKSLGVLARKK